LVCDDIIYTYKYSFIINNITYVISRSRKESRGKYNKK
jgi:hypothetical protein